MIVVKSLGTADCVRDKFLHLGYEWLGEFGIAGRRYLRKGGDDRPIRYIFLQPTTG